MADKYYITKRLANCTPTKIFLPKEWGFEPGELVCYQIRIHGSDRRPYVDTRRVAKASGTVALSVRTDWDIPPGALVDMEVWRYDDAGTGPEA